MNELALFAGAGGGILGGKLLGWRTVCAVERDAYAAQVLAQRQNDRTLEPFPIWSDVESFDGTPWRGIVDVVSGGFPCQDISSSGRKQGLAGKRSGLWLEMARIIREVGPRYVFVENSAELLHRGLGDVLGDLAGMGFDARWGVVGGAECGAPQARPRIWIVANAHGLRCEGSPQRHCEGPNAGRWPDRDRLALAQRRARDASSRIRRVDDALADRVDRTRAAGNGQIPVVAATAFTLLKR
ncbi:DNA cytosine methyltransferase [Burkholderia multivorans]|uniref:DNA cytosine methyltransferase n=1 Tax=Burkholderia multivorans TaxID=87883 RepID=UPI001C226F29|nr:DNA cytosine methyltransferase [Burkholderia multivorans]